MAVLNAYAVTLRDRWTELDDDARFELIGWIHREAEKLRDLVGSTVAAARMEAGGAGPASRERRRAVDLAREASEIPGGRGPGVRLRVGDDAERLWLECDGPQLVRLLSTLLLHGTRSATRTVDLFLDSEGANARFTVSFESDAGSGGSGGSGGSDAANDVFGFPSEPDDRRRAAFSLSLCRDIAAAHGGRILVDRADGGRTRFTFTMPWSQPPTVAAD